MQKKKCHGFSQLLSFKLEQILVTKLKASRQTLVLQSEDQFDYDIILFGFGYALLGYLLH